MNILIPDSWLREYLETAADPETLAREVSLCGPSVERIEIVEGEPVYDVEITTNRVDAACVRGFAREAAVILTAAGIEAKFLEAGQASSLSLEQFQTGNELPLPKISQQTPAVKRILAVVLDQAQNAVTPPLMAKRLRQIGENVHSSLIDITNYITHELGHPCHAFDYDKIMALGGEIVIKQVAPGKKFVTLDGVEHQTVGGEVVFESPEGEVIDLPAIKGMANTAIDEQTTRVLFWLENMDAKVVRQASMNHAIRTVAAILNEKNVDPALASETMARGLQLFQEICQAKLASPIEDQWSSKNEARTIELKLTRVKDYLGIYLEKATIEKILTALGFAVAEKGRETIVVTPPSFRSVDVTQAADVIEEVARIYGYAKLEGKLDFPVVDLARQEEYNFILESKMARLLAGKGLSEVYTYAMVNEALALEEGGELEKKLKVSNPLNDELVYLRQSLIPSLAQVYVNNRGRTGKIKGVFELAKTYFPGETDEKVREELCLAVVSDRSYREVRAWLQQLLHLAYLPEEEVRATGEIVVEGKKLGQMTVRRDGKVAFELKMLPIAAMMRKYPTYQTLNYQPMIVEDLTFVIKSETSVGPLMKQMKTVDKLIKVAKLKDIYQENYTFTYQYQGDKPLSSEEVAPVRAKVVKMMADAGHTLVGQI